MPQSSRHPHLQQHVRALLTLTFLLLPTFCGFPLLAFVVNGPMRWVALVLWLIVSGVLAWVIVRLLRAFRTLDEG
jgi:pheromone shutdown protein TraB